ncbi:DNRLRE domain-containing protein [Paenibacillus sp. LMG 31458]|uniref:DNRLRE domain-containing protein n=2 Tax=Paenibacillus phytorum TaxID=2654977 RepID=A0ABX1XZ38_9BACL|nr:DNRLRE domain-containing protein [Paenibacillus phytorum]
MMMNIRIQGGNLMRNVKAVKKKRVSCFIIALLLFAQMVLTLFTEPRTVSASSGASNMSDASFFGVWDQAGQRWTTPSKLNYDGFPGLSTVRSDVKAGNYDQAQTDLLDYYKNRTTRTIPTDFVSNPTMVPLLMDQIATPLKEYYLNTFTVAHTSTSYNMDMLSTVQGAIGTNLSFMLMGRYKGTNRANIYSLEQDCSQTPLAQCRPTLEIQYSDATGDHTANLTSTKDTYIRGNDTVIHASEPLLQVQESGAPYDSNTRKAYLNFDLSSVKGTVTAATLKLSGYSELNENTDVMIYKSGDTAWDQNTLTYANHNGKTFSWQGSPSGTDWAGPAPTIADIEYHYQITRFYWLDPLIAEYMNTNNESYAAKYIDYLIDFIVDGDASTSVSGAGSFPRNFDTGIRAASWVKAYHVLRESSSMNAQANTDLLKTFWKIGDYLNTPGGFSPDGNHGTVETQGLYTLGIYFPEFIDSAAWLSTAYSRYDFLMSTLIYKDGSYMESSDTYTTVTTAPMIAIKQLGTMNNVPFQGSFNSNLKNLGKYLADISFPNGYSVSFGDSQYTDLKGTIKQIGDLTNDDSLRYVGTAGAEGTKPSYTSILYPDSKSAIMRSGWSPNDRYLFTNVKQAAPHRHPDDNAITYYAYGRPLLVDPGAYSYSDDPISNWLRYSTESHNTIEINDTAQNLSEGWFQDWTDNSKFNFVTGVTQNVPGFKHSRETLFLKSSFSIVSDIVEAPSGTNKYQQTWHFLPTASPTLDASTKKVSTVFGDTYGDIQVVPADPEQVTATLDHGYYSNAFYSVSDATYASFTKNVSGNTTFDTVLYPTASGENRDIKVSRLPLSVPTTVASSLKVDNIGTAGTSGYYYVSHEEHPQFRRNFDTFSFDGKLAYIEKMSSGTVKSALMKSGSTLGQSGSNLIASKMPVTDIAVDWNGTTLEITGSNLVAANDPNAASAVAIRAPGVTTVKLNGNPISNFTTSGGYIYAVGVPSWSSSTGYQTSTDLGAGHSGVQSIEFDLVPTANQIGGIVGYTGQSSATNSETDLPMILRMNAEGYFDVRNGNSYGQSVRLDYKANELYHVTLLADLDSKTYNVYVAPHGKPEIQIADHFAFQTGAPVISDIGKLVMNSPVNDQYRINDHTLGQPDFIELDVTSDAYVWSGNPTLNYGTGKKLEVRNSTASTVYRHSYLRFDLGNVPTDSNAFTAKLRLTSASAGTFTDQAQFVQDDSWGETSITYNNKPAAGTVLGVWSMPSAEKSVEVDISSQYKTELVGDKQLSLVITSQTTNNISHYYYAKENGGGKPKIVIYTKKSSGRTIGAEADTMVSGSVPTANYGKNTNLEVRNSAFVPRQTFVRFDLSSLPSNVTSAKLRLTSSIVGGTFTDKVQFVSDDSWDENTTTYNNKPTGSTDLGTWEMPPAQQFVDIDVTSQVLAELAGDKKLSLGISSLTANNISHYYYSREKGSSGPQLLIETAEQTYQRDDNTIVPPPDKTPPTDAALSADTTALTNKDVTVTISYPEDAAVKEYKVGDNGTWTAYGAPVVVSANDTVYARGTDAAGNVSNVTGYMVSNIDHIAPVDATLAIDTTALTNQGVNVTISYPADAAMKEYKVGVSGAWIAYTAPVVVSDNDTVYARGTDAVGNVSNVTSITVSNIYKIAPITVATLSPASPNGKNSWYTTDITVNLTVSASVYGGAVATEYQVNDGAWTTYTGFIPAVGEGTYKLGYRSKDQAGNVEHLKTVEFKVDKTAPSLTIGLDKTSIWPANHKMVTIHATLNSSDATSGVESVVLTSITSNQPDSGQGDIQANFGTAATSFILRAEKSRIYTITYTATDKAGNKTATSVTVTVPHDQSGNQG